MGCVLVGGEELGVGWEAGGGGGGVRDSRRSEYGCSSG